MVAVSPTTELLQAWVGVASGGDVGSDVGSSVGASVSVGLGGGGTSVAVGASVVAIVSVGVLDGDRVRVAVGGTAVVGAVVGALVGALVGARGFSVGSGGSVGGGRGVDVGGTKSGPNGVRDAVARPELPEVGGDGVGTNPPPKFANAYSSFRVLSAELV